MADHGFGFEKISEGCGGGYEGEEEGCGDCDDGGYGILVVVVGHCD